MLLKWPMNIARQSLFTASIYVYLNCKAAEYMQNINAVIKTQIME